MRVGWQETLSLVSFSPPRSFLLSLFSFRPPLRHVCCHKKITLPEVLASLRISFAFVSLFFIIAVFLYCLNHFPLLYDLQISPFIEWERAGTVHVAKKTVILLLTLSFFSVQIKPCHFFMKLKSQKARKQCEESSFKSTRIFFSSLNFTTDLKFSLEKYFFFFLSIEFSGMENNLKLYWRDPKGRQIGFKFFKEMKFMTSFLLNHLTQLFKIALFTQIFKIVDSWCGFSSIICWSSWFF